MPRPRNHNHPPRPTKPKPGSCTLRLTTLPTLPNDQKTSLITSIATDITASFIYIAKAAEAGLLGPAQTESLDAVVGIVGGVDGKRRRRLERRVERYRRRLGECRREVRRVRRVVGGVVLGGWRV